MDDRERLLELVRTIQSSVVPPLVRGTEERDVSLLHGAILQELDRGGEPTVRELAALMGRSVSRTSRLVDQLATRELAERREDPNDRRVKRVRISAAGRAVLDEMQQLRVAAQLRLWEHLAEDERATVIHAMELLAQAAWRYRDART